MAFFNGVVRVLSYDDAVGGGNSPTRRHVDRNSQVQGFPCTTPVQAPLQLAPGEVATAFDGQRALGTDSATQLQLATSPLAPDRYRLKWTGTGASPAFRAERAFNAAGNTLTLTLNANLTVTVTGAGPTYSTAQVGDAVLVPGVATGDAAGPFDARNAGYWTVIGVGASSLTLMRPADQSGGLTQAVAVTSNDQFIVFGAVGVQVGDQLELSAGFSSNAQRVFPVLAVSPRWVDVQSTWALAPETAVPGATGLVVYSAAKRILYVETDQLVAVRTNGAATDLDRVDAVLTTTDGVRLGVELRTGSVWKCVVVNRSTATANVLVVAWG